MKMTRWLSPITVFRRRTPTNEQTANNCMNFVFDHSRQKDVVPERVIAGRTGSTTTMCAGGRPMALNQVELGGSPDFPGSSKGRRK